MEASNTISQEDLEEILHRRFGFRSFRPGQLEIIGSVLHGNDTLAVMPTGGGKSICYQIPALARPGIVVVISPLISLMEDQVQALRGHGIPAGCLHSGQDRETKRAVFDEMRRSERFLLYVSPERVQKAGFHRWFSESPVSLVAIDEAHCISQWGHDFRPDYTRLEVLRRLRPAVPVLALTATATPQVLDDIAAQLAMAKPDRHVYGFYRPNLYYQVEFTEGDAEKMAWIREGLEGTPQGRVIVYCGTRKQCEEVAANLGQAHGAVAYYHAGLPDEERDAVQRRFDEGDLRVLAATNAFGMGIDQPDVRLVIHYQMPGNIESLYQEMGRAGRDGEPSTCLLLYARKDKGLHHWFLRKSEAPPEVKRKRYDALETLIQYAEGGECRHAGILTYFRDHKRLERCGHCDACDPDADRRIVVPEKTLRQTWTRSRKKRARSAMAKAAAGKLLGPAEQERQQALKRWRKEYARAHEMPAFMLFSNKTMRALAVRNPRNEAELAEVYGMGPQKIEAFGREILELLAGLEG